MSLVALSIDTMLPALGTAIGQSYNGTSSPLPQGSSSSLSCHSEQCSGQKKKKSSLGSEKPTLSINRRVGTR